MTRSKKKYATNRSQRRGVSAVEFAVVAPVFFLFVFSMFEFGRIVMLQHTMTNAARIGCRRAVLATTTNEAQVQATVRQQLGISLTNTSSVTVNVSPSDFSVINTGTPVTVNVAVNYADVSWIPVSIINPRISARSVQQRE